MRGARSATLVHPWSVSAARARTWLPAPRFSFLRWLEGEADARRLFPWLAVLFACGILLRFAASEPASLAPVLIAAGLAAWCGWRWRTSLIAMAAASASSALFLGFAAAEWRLQTIGPSPIAKPVILQVTGMVEAIDRRERGARLTLWVLQTDRVGGPKPSRVRVSLRGDALPGAGATIRLRARLMPLPAPPYPGGYDAARDARFRGLDAVGNALGPWQSATATMPVPVSVRWRAAIDDARNRWTDRIASAIGGPAGALSAALVTGKRGLIPEPTNDALRASGLYHIVSISGLHMVLAAGVVFGGLRALLAIHPQLRDRWPIKKLAAVGAIAGAGAYAVFSGAEVATVRSFIMCAVMLGAILADRPALSMRNLAWAALIVLAVTPEELLGPSFQMSFLAVAGMVAAAEAWRQRQQTRAGLDDPVPPGWAGRIVFGLVAMLATTLIAGLATAVPSAFHFHRLNPFGLIGNGLALPFVSFVVMPAAVLGALLLPFGLDTPVWQLMGAGTEVVLRVARWVASLEGAVRGVRAFESHALLLCVGGFLLLTLAGAPVRWWGLLPLMAGLGGIAAAPRHDLWIDRSGATAALRQPDGQLAFLGRPPSRFMRERWHRADGAPGDAMTAAGRCDRLGCVASLPDGRTVAVVLHPEAFEEDCRRATIVITPLMAPASCQPSQLFDRRWLDRHGATTVGGTAMAPIVTTAQDPRHARPWHLPVARLQQDHTSAGQPSVSGGSRRTSESRDVVDSRDEEP